MSGAPTEISCRKSSTARAIVRGRRIAVIGTSGVIGRTTLHYALEHLAIDRVTAIGQRPASLSHRKLFKVQHSDFADCTALAGALAAQDAVVFCLGSYTGAAMDQVQRVATTSYIIELVQVLRISSPNATFLFLSGNQPDPSTQRAREHASCLAEKALREAGFPRVYIFRPAYIHPAKARKRPFFRFEPERAAHPTFRNVLLNQTVRADELARVMVECAVKGADKARAAYKRT